MKHATCHSERKHYAKGLCGSCYQLARLARIPGQRDRRNKYFRQRYRVKREQILDYWRQKYSANPEPAKERSRRWNRNNPKQKKERDRQYRLTNSERLREWDRQRYRTDPKRKKGMKEKSRRWSRSERGKIVSRITKANRRTRESGALGFASADQIQARIDFYGNRCAYCGGPFEDLDHVIPLSRGGSKRPANLRPACRHCNRSKGTKMLKEWMSSRRAA